MFIKRIKQQARNKEQHKVQSMAVHKPVHWKKLESLLQDYPWNCTDVVLTPPRWEK